MEKEFLESLKERSTKFGLVRSFGIESDVEYEEICKAHGRAIEGKGKEGDAGSEFKKDRFITFVASDETVDSYGDILRVDGCDLSRFKAGAAAFITSHDIYNINGACGVIVNARKAKNVEGCPDGKAILVTIYFPTSEEDEDADKIFRKYKARTLNAVSVGFHPIEYKIPSTDDERKKSGLGKNGIEFTKWAPYELSAVTVGANPNALARRAVEDMRKALEKQVGEGDSGNTERNEEDHVSQVKSFFEANPIKIK